jgi:hypothetical protein
MPNYSEIYRRKFLLAQSKLGTRYLNLFGKIARDVGQLRNDPRARFVTSYDFTKSKPLKKLVAKATLEFESRSLQLLRNGQEEAVKISFDKDELIMDDFLRGLRLLGKDFKDFKDQIPNYSAVKAFVMRDHDVMTLSENVWRIADQYRAELEAHLGLGIMNGDSASTISRRIRKYLNNPDALFHKVKDKNGKLVPSRKMLNYKVPRGTYKSAYKNAMRVTRTETNQAYLLADHYKWLNDPTVIGVRIKLSGSHPEYKFPEICEILEGDYPKAFVWVGWHPHCLCYSTPILSNREDFKAWLRGDLNYIQNTQITTVPDEFKDYIRQNQGKIAKMKNKPYFVLDNYKSGNIAFGLNDFGTPVQSNRPYQPAAPPTPTPPTEPIPAPMLDPLAEKVYALLNTTTTIQEVDDIAKYLLGSRAFKHGVTNLSLYKLAVERLYTLRKQYKIGDITWIGAENRKRAWASASPRSFNMNPKYWNDPTEMLKGLKLSMEERFHPVGCDTVRSIIDHEAGHIITNDALRWEKLSGSALASWPTAKLAIYRQFNKDILALKANYSRTLRKIKNEVKAVLESEKDSIKTYDVVIQGQIEQRGTDFESMMRRWNWWQKKGAIYTQSKIAEYVDESLMSTKSKAKIMQLFEQFDREFLSEYADKNKFEFLAEGFTSALNNPDGNRWATEVKKLVDQIWKR